MPDGVPGEVYSLIEDRLARLREEYKADMLVCENGLRRDISGLFQRTHELSVNGDQNREAIRELRMEVRVGYSALSWRLTLAIGMTAAFTAGLGLKELPAVIRAVQAAVLSSAWG